MMVDGGTNDEFANQMRLTNHSANDHNPVFTTDGSRIVFVSDRDGNNEIYIMNADGSEQTRLTNNSADDRAPATIQPRFSVNCFRIVIGPLFP